MKSRRLVLTLLGCLGLVLSGCGEDGEVEPPVRGGGADRAFVASLQKHDERSIALADYVRAESKTAEVRALAGRIADTRENEIADLRFQDSKLVEAGVEDFARIRPTARLRLRPLEETPRRRFDEEALAALLEDQRGAVEVARAQLRDGRNPELKALAEVAIGTRRREATQLRQFTKALRERREERERRRRDSADG